MKRLVLSIVLLAIAFVARAYYFLADGVAYNTTSDTTCIVVKRNTDEPYQLKHVNIPPFVYNQGRNFTVTAIGSYAFGYSTIESITLPTTITTIGDSAFNYCKSLKQITLPDAITTIGNHAFEGSGLKAITLPPAIDVIPSRAFADCTELKHIRLPAQLEHIDSGAFLGCSALKEIKIPALVHMICNEAFSECRSLKKVSVDPNNITYDSRNGCNAIIETSTGKLRFGFSSTRIPNSVETLGHGAFAYVAGLKHISIPANITKIEDNAFFSCEDLETIVIPPSVNELGMGVFADCTSLKTIFLPNTIKEIPPDTFRNCEKLEYITLPDSIISIGDGAFWGCARISEIALPPSLEFIGNAAFLECYGLTRISIPQQTSVIGDGIFYNCKNLTDVILPESITAIGQSMFYNCKSLHHITIPKTVKEINLGAFDCSGIMSIELPSSVTTIGDNAFRFCEDLTTIIIPNIVSSIGDGAFDQCYKLQTINIPDSLTVINQYIFQDCRSLSEVILPTKITKIGKGAFKRCTSLRKVFLPDSLIVIDDKAFANCGNLTDVSFPCNLNHIGKEAFAGCINMGEISLPRSIISVGENAFDRCTSLRLNVITDSLVTVSNTQDKMRFTLDKPFHRMEKVWLEPGMPGYTTDTLNILRYGELTGKLSYNPIEETITLQVQKDELEQAIKREWNTYYRFEIDVNYHFVLNNGERYESNFLTEAGYYVNSHSDRWNHQDKRFYYCIDFPCNEALKTSLLEAALDSLIISCNHDEVSLALNPQFATLANNMLRSAVLDQISSIQQLYNNSELHENTKKEAYRYTKIRRMREDALKLFLDRIRNYNRTAMRVGLYDTQPIEEEDGQSFQLKKWSDNGQFDELWELQRGDMMSFFGVGDLAAVNYFNYIAMKFENYDVINNAGFELSSNRDYWETVWGYSHLDHYLHFLNMVDAHTDDINEAWQYYNLASDELTNWPEYNSYQILLDLAKLKLYNLVGDTRAAREMIISDAFDDYRDDLDFRSQLLEYYRNCEWWQQSITLIDSLISATQRTICLYQSTNNQAYREIAHLLRLKADCLAQLGDYESSNIAQKESLAILDKYAYTFAADFCEGYLALAAYQYDSGNYAEALVYSEFATRLSLDISHGQSPLYDTNMPKYLHVNGHPEEAAGYISFLSKELQDNVGTLMLKHDTRARQHYWNRYRNWFQQDIPMLAHQLGHPDVFKVAYDATLISKGLLLNTEVSIKQLVEETGGTLQEAYDNWQVLNNSMPQDQQNIDEHFRRQDQAEREFIKQLRESIGLLRPLSISWRDVRNALKSDEIAIEFVNYGFVADSVAYSAIVLKNNEQDSTPRFYHLFTIPSALQLSKINDDELSKILWGALEPIIGKANTVYFSPIGELYNIAIESLPAWDNKNVIVSERRNIYRLSSTREIALRDYRYQSNGFEAVAYGGLRYNMEEEQLLRDSKRYNLPRLTRDIAEDLDLSDRGVVRTLDPLPGTLDEVEHIKDLYYRVHPDHIITLTDTLGTETSFKALTGKHTRLIHIATHGFYGHNYITSKYSRGTDNKYRLGYLSVEDSIMLQCGLFMAGAQHKVSHKNPTAEYDDGVLTAYEVSHIDLRGLDLIVLSACHTGEGHVSEEGVFGLQRGFKKAGAQTIVMSLREVTDEATAFFMRTFYQHLFNNESKYEAFERAKTATRLKYQNDADSKRRNCWNAFIILDAL